MALTYTNLEDNFQFKMDALINIMLSRTMNIIIDVNHEFMIPQIILKFPDILPI